MKLSVSFTPDLWGRMWCTIQLGHYSVGPIELDGRALVYHDGRENVAEITIPVGKTIGAEIEVRDENQG